MRSQLLLACMACLFPLWLGSQVLTSHMTPTPVSQSAVSAGDRFQGQPIPIDPAVRTGILPNGMKYYIRRNVKPEHRAELRLAVAAGSVQEDDDQQGLAHFVEHMAFNGSEHFSKNELVDYLESVGTRFGPDLNAYTSFDETVYMLQVRTDDAEQLAKGLLVLHDWAGGVSFDAEEIDKERGVVMSEWRSRLSAEQRMQQEYLPKLYYNSRYALRLPIGDPDIIEHAPYDAVRRFYREWYRPDLMALCVVGDFDVDQMEQQIRDRFSGIRNPDNPRKKDTYSVPGHPQTLVSVLTDKEATSTVIRMIYKHQYHTAQNIDDYREELLHSLYNAMLNARLYEVNNTADPPFVFAYSGYGGDVGDLATYSAFARVPEQGVERGFVTLLTENERVRRHGFLASELERQKVEMLTRAERSVREQDKTESSRYVSRCVYHFLENEPMPSEAQTLALYQQLLPTIEVEEVNQLAGKWMTNENRVIIVTGPEKEGVVLPGEDRLLALISEVNTSEITPYVDNVSDEPLFAHELRPAKVIAESVVPDLDIHTFVLENGIQVRYKQTDFKNDEVLMAGYSWGGSSLYDDATYPSIQAMGSVIRESGVGNFDAPQLDKKLTGKTVYVSPFVGERYEGVSGSCSPKDLEVLFQLTYLYATQPRMEEDAVQAYLIKQRSFVENLMSNPNNYFGDVVNRLRYENHPRRGYPRLEDLEKVNMAAMQDVYADRFLDMSDFVFMFTGAFDPVVLKDLCAKYLGNLPVTNRKETWKDIGVHSPPGVLDTLFYRGEAPRSNVRLIYHGDAHWSEDDAYALNAMTDYARIKLRESLREELGGVYGVSIGSAMVKEPREEYSIQISFNADPPRTQELIDATYAVIDQIRQGEILQADVDKVKELQRQERIKNLKENRYWQSALIGEWYDGTPYQNMTEEHLETQLATLTPALIQHSAQAYFGENRIEVVMLPEEN